MRSRHVLKSIAKLAAGSVALAFLNATAVAADLSRATDWLGHVVVTEDGEELGTVRDIAIDERTGKIRYLVVSVGSFLIENNLIAVAPDALVASRDDVTLLLQADPETLRRATRFATDSDWPLQPDVLRGNEVRAAVRPAEPSTPADEPAAASRPPGTATIESPTKTAHLSASERYIKPTAPPAPPTPPAAANAPSSKTKPPALDTPFDRLDKDGDGVLNRAEIAHVISPKDSYSKLDRNANGVIDRDEFDALTDGR
jgi:sporulation protein YlmC with PRC-barrel domain